jgi:hypothetical protein
MRRWCVLLAPMAAACVSVPAFPAEETAEAACPNGRSDIPAEWNGWDKARPLAAVTAQADLGAAFAAGQAVDLTLRPDPEVTYVTLPKGAGEASSFGGLASVHVERAGRYSVGLSAPAWVDLTRDGKTTESVAHGHGPACSPIYKAVAFDLTPGDYVVEISGNETADIRVMLASGG